MSVVDTLIFDRTQSDIINDTDKAYIDYKDLNRIEEAIEYLFYVLKKYDYYSDVKTKKWSIDEFRKEEDCERIKESYKAIKDSFSYKFDVPDFNWETIEEANEIEKILYDIDFLLNNMPKVFIHSGVAKCGQNRIYQHRFRRTQIWSVLESFSQFADTDIVNDIASQEEGKILEGTEKLNLVQIEKTQRVVDFITSFNNNMNELDRLIGEEVE